MRSEQDGAQTPAVSGGQVGQSGPFEALSGGLSGGIARAAFGLAHLMASDPDAYALALEGLDS